MAAFLAPAIITGFWAIIGIICPIFAKGPNRGIIQCCLMLAAACCWLFWLCCYMTQLNPLIGPKLSRHAILMIGEKWGNKIEEDTS